MTTIGSGTIGSGTIGNPGGVVVAPEPTTSFQYYDDLPVTLEATAEQREAALTSENRTVAFRYEILDYQNNHVSWASKQFSDGKVSNNSLAEIKRTATFTVKDDLAIDWSSDRIRPWMLVKMPDSEFWLEWPLGVFLPESPARDVRGGYISRDVEAYDQLKVLQDDAFEARFVARKGDNFVDMVVSILNDAGIFDIRVEPTDEVLVIDREWDPGTTKRDVANDLLSAINYNSLVFDAYGQCVIGSYVAPGDAPPRRAYWDDDDSLYSPDGLQQSMDLFTIANKWVVYTSDVDNTLYSVYENDDPGSPTSTVARKRVITDFRSEDPAVPTQAVLDAIVKRIAQEASEVLEVIEVETRTMPDHGDRDILQFRSTQLGVEPTLYSEHEWSFTLAAGETMNHRLRRFITI